MDSISKKYWEDRYSSDNVRYPDYDGWLDKYAADFKSAATIIDLGCGNGVDTIFLATQNLHTIACDFSETALSQLNKILPRAQARCFDMRDSFPFDSASADVLIADLSIHYFEWKVTEKIVSEIFRVLTDAGILLCRVNSTKNLDEISGASVIEPGYYDNSRNRKRYFDREAIEKLFSEYLICYMAEDITGKYHSEKFLWEVAVKKRPSPFSD